MPNRTTALPLPLPPEFSLTPVNAENNAKIIPRQEKQQLWLCLYFPNMSLETVTETNDKIAQAVINEQSRGLFIHTPSALAETLGINKNMPLNAAYALCPELKICHRNIDQENKNMAKIADWAQTFTSHVNIVSTNKVLLEVKKSLALFSGLTALLKKLEDSLADNWHNNYHIAVSPTPFASQILCELTNKIIIENAKSLRPVMAKISVSHLLKDNPRLQKKIEKTGIKTIQDLWRLPRDGLARRFGPALLKSLDQLTTASLDPQSTYKTPLVFKDTIDLPMETASVKIITYTSHTLIEKLSKFLNYNDMGIVKLCIKLKHSTQTTDILLHFRQMSRSSSHILNLFIEKMERTRLIAPVLSVSLYAEEILPFMVLKPSLFPSLNIKNDNGSNNHEWENTLEQLQNRLGHHAVKYLTTLDEIHPNHAWRYQSTPFITQQPGAEHRPLWLLNVERPLLIENNQPFFRGLLSFLHGPERIQTGWWRGKKHYISRDYYIALSPNVGYLWIYRDLKQNNCWYLHGFFG